MLALIIIVFAIAFDQFTKYLVVQNIPLHDSIPFIDGFMEFYHTRNTGAAWSIMNGGGWERFILLSVSILAICLMGYILFRFYKRHLLLTISLSMVLGGAIGNMIDRIRLEYVVDFLSTQFIRFPTFNIADCFICVGAGLMAVYVIFFDAKVEERIKAEQNSEENSENG